MKKDRERKKIYVRSKGRVRKADFEDEFDWEHGLAFFQNCDH